ncbi:MAG TPA: TM0106 family RecB-like putative nuclease, partial [Chryseolinea sp.]|nr:TM0106 family RecB-like putative nuclease [Chryseolinea sp.]
WGHDREQERQAFVDFMDFVTLRLQRYPGMHIYHYAHYENTALKRLMSLHGVKESAVDQLLREHRMVDLYKVVREGLRISKPSYSIKDVEAFYAEKRTTEVKKAMDSIVVYERWRENGDPALLESIRQYNEDDCRSTWQLRKWLLMLRPAGLPWYSVEIAADAKTKIARNKSDNIIKLEAKLGSYHRRLILHPENPSLDPELAKLIDSLLDFHRRAAKPAWWSLFERQDAEFEALLEDPEVIAGLHAPELLGDGDRNELYRFRYPEQDFKVRAGSRAKRLDNLRDVLVVAIDEDACTIDVELRADELPTSLSISIGAPVNADAMRDAVFSFADSVIKGETRYKSVLDYLARRVPDVKDIATGTPIVISGTEPLPQIISAVERMQNSYLFIQGPPGTGKTHTGSHLIAALLQAGKRVAVSANSHKVIINLLEAVDRQMKEVGASYAGMKKVSTNDHCIDSDFIENVTNGDQIADASPPPQLVAGTAWLLSKPDFWGEFDYLFIDEAGQVSLANMIAMGMCAKNLILLGDQMQLGQPIQGIHPGRSGDSALDYLLDGEATIAAERGIFLEKTFRMHPDVCRFISDAFYDSRLESDSSTFGQSLVLDGNAHPALKPTGIRYLPVEHDGCSQRSEEEAAVVSELVDNLLTQRYQNKRGEIHPFTLDDILVVAPYNMQVNLLKRTLPKGTLVGTVDKFQGQEAEVVIVSMATSSQEFLPRYLDFAFSKNRLNVAASRARSLSILVLSPLLLNTQSTSTHHLTLINTFLAASIYGQQ